MRNIVLNDIAHEERSDIDTDNRIDQVEPVERRSRKTLSKKQLYLADKPMQRESGNGSKQSHKETQDKRELPV